MQAMAQLDLYYLRRQFYMPYVKLVAILLATSVVFAITSNLIFLLVARFAGGAVIGATNRGWIILLFTWWIISFLVGIRLAIVLHVFPFSLSK
jgi:hypothetical protein